MQDAILPKKGDMIKHLSIIICTFNRSEILLECLNAIKSISESLEIIVVNNDKDDNIERIKLVFPNIKFVVEPSVGLSHARNRGVKEASNDWLFFIDDDALLIEGSIDQVISTIKNYNFMMFGGVWSAWYKTVPPKWIPFSTGNYIIKGSNTVRDIGDDYVSGGVMVINKKVLLDVGGFPTNVGMNGKIIGYGEENYVETKIRELGYKVGFNPEIRINHLVAPYKYTIKWHLKSAFAMGRDQYIINEGKMSTLKLFGSMVKNIFWRPAKNLIKLLISKKYYWQNFLIDTLGAIIYNYGQFVSHIKIK